MVSFFFFFPPPPVKRLFVHRPSPSIQMIPPFSFPFFLPELFEVRHVRYRFPKRARLFPLLPHRLFDIHRLFVPRPIFLSSTFPFSPPFAGQFCKIPGGQATNYALFPFSFFSFFPNANTHRRSICYLMLMCIFSFSFPPPFSSVLRSSARRFTRSTWFFYIQASPSLFPFFSEIGAIARLVQFQVTWVSRLQISRHRYVSSPPLLLLPSLQGRTDRASALRSSRHRPKVGRTVSARSPIFHPPSFFFFSFPFPYSAEKRRREKRCTLPLARDEPNYIPPLLPFLFPPFSPPLTRWHKLSTSS